MLTTLACITAADPVPNDSLEKYRDAIQKGGVTLTGNGSATYVGFECANKTDQATINIPPGKKGSVGTFTFNMVTNGQYNTFCELQNEDEKYDWPGGGTYEYDTGKLVFQTCASGARSVARGESVLESAFGAMYVKGTFKCYDAEDDGLIYSVDYNVALSALEDK